MLFPCSIMTCYRRFCSALLDMQHLETKLSRLDGFKRQSLTATGEISTKGHLLRTRHSMLGMLCRQACIKLSFAAHFTSDGSIGPLISEKLSV